MSAIVKRVHLEAFPVSQTDLSFLSLVDFLNDLFSRGVFSFDFTDGTKSVKLSWDGHVYTDTELTQQLRDGAIEPLMKIAIARSWGQGKNMPDHQLLACHGVDYLGESGKSQITFLEMSSNDEVWDRLFVAWMNHGTDPTLFSSFDGGFFYAVQLWCYFFEDCPFRAMQTFSKI